MTSKALEPIPYLRPLSWLYAAGVAARNKAIDLGLRRVSRLARPVISVGNLSVGGSGKTPFVALLVERMRARGLRVGVLARGYGKQAGEALNDEGRLLAQRFPGLAQRQQPSRLEAGQALLEDEEVDLFLLDDGYQHRQLHRDVDICLVDARRPGGGGLLPAGYLREPLRALRRAHVVVLSQAGGLEGAELARRREELRSFCRADALCYAAETVPRDLLSLPEDETAPCQALAGRDVALLAGIARPERFVRSVEGLGARVVSQRFVRDHAPIAASLLEAESERARARGALLLLTEKDEARMKLGRSSGPARSVLRIDLRFVGDDPGLDVFLPPEMRGEAGAARGAH